MPIIRLELVKIIMNLFRFSDYGQNIITENRLSIHIESGNILYDNFNTNRNF